VLSIVGVSVEESNHLFYSNKAESYIPFKLGFNFLIDQVSLVVENVAIVTSLSQFLSQYSNQVTNNNLVLLSFSILVTLFFSQVYSPNAKNLFYRISKLILLTTYVALILFLKNFIVIQYIGFFDIFSLVVLISLIFLMSNIKLPKIKNLETAILLYLVGCFGWFLISATDYAFFIICIEGFSLTLYILATISGSHSGITAATKYFAFGTLGSLLLYWSALNMFEEFCSMDIIQFNSLSLVTIESGLTNSKIVWIQSLAILGLLIKLGASPFHQWIADVYSGVPLIITAFYSTFVKLVLFIVFVQFAVTFTSAADIEYSALISLIVGCFITLRQTDIKRFLAWGSITHTSYLMIGDTTSIYIYVLTYMLASILFFSTILFLRYKGKEIAYLSDLRFIGTRFSNQRLLLLISLASMAGLPPFAGFYGKLFVWSSLAEDVYLYNDFWSVSLLLLSTLTSLIVMFYYTQVMCVLFVNDEISLKNNENLININPINTLKKSKFVKYLQYSNTWVIVLWTFIIYNLLNIIN
jgi:NADH-quinone oxidoreductase subunit N